MMGAPGLALLPSPPGPDPVDRRVPLVAGEPRLHDITEVVARPVERPTLRGWWLGFGLSAATATFGLVAIGNLFARGTGIWGLNRPVGWAFDITNFVFWIGIGHAGTLISAILYLLRQKWRTSINRFAEAMTLFAVLCAIMFPTIHVGRPWFLYWAAPIPNAMGLWPNFRSPLLWDFFAVSIYGTVSFLFWFVGLIPDFATLRDRATTKWRQRIYGFLALGWRGSARHWLHYERVYLMIAALAAPLVLSVHTIVSFDFATSVLSGWHSTIFPPYFVAGAVFSGFALVMTLMLIARKVYGLEHLVTAKHLENMNKVMLFMGLVVGYAYGVEVFTAWYSGNLYEWFGAKNRALGPYAWAFWIMVGCNAFVPQLFWSRRLRRSVPVMFVVSILINVGMWFERFVIIVTSLHRDFLPSSWGHFTPTFWDFATLIGSFGIFFTLFFLFLRFVPMVAISEVKTLLPEAQTHAPAAAPAEEQAAHAHP
jgi:molybdopterin-containing oxidoreductase family membrane subunit